MNDYKEIEREVRVLSEKAKVLLNDVASCVKEPTNQQIKDLDWYAINISKLSYGNNRPEFINQEIYNLISWCDHIHEPDIKTEFIAALSSRPLEMPPWSSS